MACLLVLSLFYDPVCAQGGNWYKTDSGCEVWSTSPAKVLWAGPCRDGRAAGFGTATWILVVDGRRSEESFQGDMRDGMPHGDGVYIYKNGDSYSGQFQQGARHGRGLYTWASGQRFEGEFVEGELHGVGHCDFGNTRPVMCRYEHGKFVQ